jgi:Holliday junction DNA helicase RuvA
VIALLTGRVVERDGSRGILDVRGVGYEVFAATGTLDKWVEADGDVVAHIYTQVSEDTLSLYGFEGGEERRAFVTMIGVSGVGPKGALAALETMPVSDLAQACDSGNIATLSRIKGVGKKTAQRMALELKGKLPITFSVNSAAKAAVAGDQLPLALDRLGYSKAEISRAMAALAAQGVGDDEPVPTRLRAALAVLSGVGS